MRIGIYYTHSNHLAYVPKHESEVAFDLNKREWIPISEVREGTFIRQAGPEERALAAQVNYYPNNHRGLL